MERSEATLRPEVKRMTPHVPTWDHRSGLNFDEVEAVLDGLEVAGVREREVQVEVGGTFGVRWKAR